MGDKILRHKGTKAKQVADVLRGRSREIKAFALRAPDGRLYIDFSEPMSIAALRDFYVFTDEKMAREFQKMEKGSSVVPVKFRVDITIGKE